MNFPPYISRTPPPLNETEEDEDEEFGTFVVCSDLGEEVCDDFGKSSQVIKSEDNVSEDSGFCMNSVGQTQSPSDISPLSHSISKGNEYIGIDNHGDFVLNGSIKELSTNKTGDIKSNDSFNEGTLLKDCEELEVLDVFCHYSEAPKTSEHINTSIKKEILVNGHDLVKVNCVDDHASRDFIINNTLTDEVFSEVGCVNDSIKNDFVINNVITDDITSNIECNDEIASKDGEVTLEVASCSQVLAKRNNLEYNENAKINWFTTPEPSDLNTFTNTEPAFKSNNSNSEENSVCFTPLQGLVIPNSSSAIQNSNSEANFTINRDIDDWNSNDDEFSEFTSFQVVDSFDQAETPLNKEKDQFEQSICGGFNSDYFIGSLHLAIENSIVWTNLECFEGTSAFKYQWSTSVSQLKFLQALQIDSRNILYGPWSRVNKFHMTEVSSSFESNNNCSKGCSYSSVSTKKKEIIPDPYFDWTSSGLINPLQGPSIEKETVQHKREEKVVSVIISTKSKEVLNSLPKLNFLKSSVINFK